MKNWRETWLKVAEAFGTPPESRTDEQLEITKSGLCRAFYISSSARCMYILKRISYLGKNNISGYWFPTSFFSGTNEYDDLRCLYACLFAAMTQKEFEDVSK